MSLQATWEQHRRFVMTVAGGLAMFLILNVLIQGCRAGAVATERDNGKKVTEILKTLDELDLTYDREIKESQVLAQQREDLLGRVSVVRNARVRPGGEKTDPGIDFRRRQDQVWSAFENRAKRVNLTFPKQGDVNFALSTDLDPEEWADRYCHLDIVDRIFRVAIDIGVRSIESIAPLPVVSESIPGFQDRALIRYPLALETKAPFLAYLKLIEHFQRDHEMLAIEIDELERDEADPPGLIRGKLTFVGLDLGAPRDTRASPQRSTRGGFRGRR